MSHKYQVGDRVSYDQYSGIIQEILPGKRYTILFGDDFSRRYNVTALYSMPESLIGTTLPELSQEERVQQKIKVLWNKSKYVKKNPQYAY